MGYCQRRSRDLSALAIWLVRLGIHVSFSTPMHPQTNGKDERFHRTFKAEVLHGAFANLVEAQQAFDRWRDIYNHIRPHEAIDMEVPAERYQPSPRPFPETLPVIEYSSGDHVLRVRARGRVRFQGRHLQVSTALQATPLPHALTMMKTASTISTFPTIDS